MPPDSKAPLHGVVVGAILADKYRVERVIGEGGMGVVVAATHLQLDTMVALKFITHDNGQSVARFVREARSAVRLKSEHVARVSDVGTLDNGMPYMVMEYLEGRDLHHVLADEGPLPLADAVGYVIHASEAVAEAHALGIVHRDLKPHNLFLTTGVGGRPKVKVLDFGISKAPGYDLSLTRSAEIVGTPTYMAPEQLKASKELDLRADIWALGVILYELLTGRVPFEAETLAELCSKVLTELPPSPKEYRADIPAPVAEAILRCLSRAPADRYADVGELVTVLAPYAPDWARASAVLDVPKSSASNPGRAVVSSTSHKLSGSDAAWSETELAPAPRSRWRLPLAALGSSVAVVLLVVGAWRMGASGAHPTTPLLVAAAPPPSSPLPAPPASSAPGVVAAPEPREAPAPPPVAPVSTPSARPTPAKPRVTPPASRASRPEAPRAPAEPAGTAEAYESR